MIERLYTLFRLNSLKRRLQFWFIILIVSFIILIAIPFTLYGTSFREDEAQSNIQQMIDLQQMVINKWFEEKSTTVKTISQLPAVKSLDKEKTQQLLETYKNSYSDFYGLAYINELGISEIDTLGSTGINYSDRLYFQEAKLGKQYVSDVLIGRQTNQAIIAFSAPIFDNMNQFKGLIVGVVHLDTINNVMENFRYRKTGQTYIVNKSGQIITKLRISSQNKNTLDSMILSSALQDEKLTSSYRDYRGEEVFGDYRWVNDDKWLIIGEVAKSDMFTPFYRMRAIIIGAFIIVLALGLFITFWLSNRVEGIFRKVLEGAQSMRSGDYQYRIEPHVFNNFSHELQDLCKMFNRMAETIQFQMASVRRNEEQFRLLAEYSSDMITMHDKNGFYLYTSPVCKEILQYEEEELIGKSAFMFIHPDDHTISLNSHNNLFKKGYSVVTYRIRRKDGEYIWFESSTRLLQGTEVDDLKIIVVSRNISKRKLAEQKLQETNEMLQRLSTIDGLTGIANRRAFDERLNLEWNRSYRHSTPISLIMLDIDYFKAYNDTYGHQGGDECLKEVATIIQSTLERTTDLLCRYGGEEFGIILPETDERGAENVGEKIKTAIEEARIPHTQSKIGSYVTISVGIATIIASDGNFPTSMLISNADAALYRAKEEGRNCVKTFKHDSK